MECGEDALPMEVSAVGHDESAGSLGRVAYLEGFGGRRGNWAGSARHRVLSGLRLEWHRCRRGRRVELLLQHALQRARWKKNSGWMGRR